MRRTETKEEIERKQKWATEGTAAAKPEDISVLLGRIRTCAEHIVRCNAETVGGHLVENVFTAERILALIEQAQKAVLEAQLSASIKAVQK